MSNTAFLNLQSDPYALDALLDDHTMLSHMTVAEIKNRLTNLDRYNPALIPTFVLRVLKANPTDINILHKFLEYPLLWRDDVISSTLISYVNSHKRAELEAWSYYQIHGLMYDMVSSPMFSNQSHSRLVDLVQDAPTPLDVFFPTVEACLGVKEPKSYAIVDTSFEQHRIVSLFRLFLELGMDLDSRIPLQQVRTTSWQTLNPSFPNGFQGLLELVGATEKEFGFNVQKLVDCLLIAGVDYKPALEPSFCLSEKSRQLVFDHPRFRADLLLDVVQSSRPVDLLVGCLRSEL